MKQLTSEHLRYLQKSAINAAKKAGDIIIASDTRQIDVKAKSGGDTIASQVVTDVDLRCETSIINTLQQSIDEYDLGLLSEERGDDGSRFEKDYFWCVDPMDGTLSYIEGVPGYSVSIGLVSRSGQAVIGVVYDPVKKTLYSAVIGQGAMRDGKPWKLDNAASKAAKPLTLVCDRGLEEKAFYPGLLDSLQAFAEALGASGLSTLHKGGAVMNGCWVLENTPACYFKRPKSAQGGGSLWDFAAIACLFNEAGGIATDFFGEPLNLNQAETTFMNEKGVIFASHPQLAETIHQLTFN